MKALLRTLKPTSLGVIFIVLILVVQGSFFTNSVEIIYPDPNTPPKEFLELGIGTPIRIDWENGKSSHVIRWSILLLNLTLTYLAGLLLAKLLVKLTGLRRPTLTVGKVILTMILLTFLLAISCSKFYWGYYFSRPPVFEETNIFDKVPAVVFIQIDKDDTGKHSLTSDSSETFSRVNNPTDPDEYYALNERILKDLANRNLLPAEPAKTLDGYPDLVALIHKSSVLVPSAKGYDSAARMNGVAVRALDKSGSPFLFIGLRGWQESNDHYPFYEMLFRGNKDSSEFTLIRSQMFYFDVAGMEGFEWPVIWLYIAVPGIVLGLFIFVIARALWRLIKRNPQSQP